MKKHTLMAGTTLCIFLWLLKTSAAQTLPPRISLDFNAAWRFHLGEEQEASSPSFDDTQWRTLDLPHDWSIEGNFSEKNPAGYNGGALPGGIAWYRKSFAIEELNKFKAVYIHFDGVYQHSEVWINGHYLGKRPNGYISFRYNIADFLYRDGRKNVLAVKVDNMQQPNSRWYSGSGIYRPVRLTATGSVAIDENGICITTPYVSPKESIVNMETTILNKSKRPIACYVQTSIIDSGNRVVAKGGQWIKNLLDSVPITVTEKLSVIAPNLWSPEKPTRYRAVTEVLNNDTLIDKVETSFGIRTFHFDQENGFVLNGKPTKILGVCNHHDLGALGAALHLRALERQLELLKEMGCNAIRTAHNPPAPALLDLCDRMGFIVMDEAFDTWKKEKTKYGYHEQWDEWHQQDLIDQIKRDRNHPSVFIWSIGNEIPEQWEESGKNIAKELAEIVKSVDTTRPITVGLNEPYPHNSIYQSGKLDLVGFNYHHQDFESFQDSFPHQRFIATETTSALQTRGFYQMPSDSIKRWPYKWDEPFLDGNADHTVSSYDHVSTPWGSTHEETWKLIKKHPYLSGFYIWTGFDYLGEPTPYTWPARSSYFGILDLAGFPKDVYYMYQSEWTQKPVLHLFPHWNWKKGQTIDLWCYYNQADEVELYVNGRSLGKRHKTGDELHVSWRVLFEPGKVDVVSRKHGKEVLRKSIHTAGAPARIELVADRMNLHADEKDLAFITAKVVDNAGNLVPIANNELHFHVEGSGKLIATDNGNPVDHSSFQSANRKTMAGLALGIVKASKEDGQIVVTVSSEGLKTGSIQLNNNK